MKKLFYAAFAAMALSACIGQKADPNAYNIAGTVSDVDGQAVILLQGRDTLAVDTVRNGQFTFTGKADSVPGTAYVVVDRQHYVEAVLEPGKILVDLDSQRVSGTLLNEKLNAYAQQVEALVIASNQPGANQDSIEQTYMQMVSETAAANQGNALGLMLVKELAYDMTLAELDSVMALCPLYAQDEQLQKLHNSKEAAQNTEAGKPYVDIVGVDAQSGQPVKLSEIVAQGKPVIVDFWASWCGPCRREINEFLSKYAAEYRQKVNFVGIAVWENGIEDTQKAIDELPISWPVIFAGGRGEESPTNAYGINGIPHIMLIAPDGTIVARNLRGEKIAEAIEAL